VDENDATRCDAIELFPMISTNPNASVGRRERAWIKIYCADRILQNFVDLDGTEECDPAIDEDTETELSSKDCQDSHANWWRCRARRRLDEQRRRSLSRVQSPPASTTSSGT